MKKCTTRSKIPVNVLLAMADGARLILLGGTPFLLDGASRLHRLVPDGVYQRLREQEYIGALHMFSADVGEVEIALKVHTVVEAIRLSRQKYSQLVLDFDLDDEGEGIEQPALWGEG